MLSVKFHRATDAVDNEDVGTIRWDDVRGFTLEPPDSERLKRILSDPVYMEIGGDLLDIKSDDPVLFMQGLPLHYHGSRFWADPLQDDGVYEEGSGDGVDAVGSAV